MHVTAWPILSLIILSIMQFTLMLFLLFLHSLMLASWLTFSFLSLLGELFVIFCLCCLFLGLVLSKLHICACRSLSSFLVSFNSVSICVGPILLTSFCSSLNLFVRES